MRVIDKIEFERMPLLAHKFLDGVPLHSLSRLDLRGGKSGMTVLDVKETTGFNTGKLEAGVVTKTMFWLRGLIGSVFGWDKAEELAESVSFLPLLSDEDRDRSLIPPGKQEGISRVLYCFENEFLAQIINKTVHCFWVMATKQTTGGYILYLAVYVRKLNWFTPIYMAFVTPILNWIIYPAMQKSVRKYWQQAQESKLQKAVHA